MKLDLCTIVAGEYLFLGLILYTVPDLFFNSADGLFKVISGVRATELESNHFDPMFEIITNLKGAGVLSFVAMILMSKDSMTRNHLLRTGFYIHFFLFLLYGHAVITADNQYLSLPMIGLYAGKFFGYALWFLVEAVNHASEDTVKRTRAKLPRILGLVAFILFLGHFAVMDAFYPHHFEPGKPMALWKTTTLPDNTKDDLAIFQTRAVGAINLAFTCSAVEILLFDRSVEKLRWFNQPAVVSITLYLIIFMRAALDDTGYALKKAWVMISVVTTLFLLAQLADIFGVWKLNNVEKTFKIDSESKVPELTTEQDKKLK